MAGCGSLGKRSVRPYTEPMTLDLNKAQAALTEKQRNFVELWLRHRNAHMAYNEAFDAKRMNPATSYRNGHRMLNHAKIRPIIDARLEQLGETLSDETELTVMRVLQEFMTLATADPDEVTGVRVGACRHCWGVDHQYQWTPAEFMEATRNAERAEKDLPDPAGGIDFDRTALPNGDCPECRGEGILRQVPVDTSKLSPGGRALFAGVKPTAHGIEIKLRDRDKAMENAAKIVGAFKETIDLNVKAAVDVSKVTPETAAEVYKEMLK